MERIQGGHPAGVASLNLPSYEDQVRTCEDGATLAWPLDCTMLGSAVLAYVGLRGVFRDEPLCAQHSHFMVVVLRVIYRGHHSKLPSAR